MNCRTSMATDLMIYGLTFRVQVASMYHWTHVALLFYVTINPNRYRGPLRYVTLNLPSPVHPAQQPLWFPTIHPQSSKLIHNRPSCSNEAPSDKVHKPGLHQPCLQSYVLLYHTTSWCYDHETVELSPFPLEASDTPLAISAFWCAICTIQSWGLNHVHQDDI